MIIDIWYFIFDILYLLSYTYLTLDIWNLMYGDWIWYVISHTCFFYKWYLDFYIWNLITHNWYLVYGVLDILNFISAIWYLTLDINLSNTCYLIFDVRYLYMRDDTWYQIINIWYLITDTFCCNRQNYWTVPTPIPNCKWNNE